MRKVIFLLIFLPTLVLSQGKLEQAKQNLSSRTSSSSSTTTSNSSSNNDNDADLSFIGEFFIEIFAFVGYKMAFGDFQNRYFTPYPYYFDNVNGEYDFGFELGDKASLLKLGVNYLPSNIVTSIEAHANYRFNPFVGVELYHQSFFESVREGTDYLDVTSLGINFYRIRERFITAWWGVGLSYAGTDVNQLGFMATLGAEIYPFKPFSLDVSFQHASFRFNNISNIRSKLKYHHKNKAYYIGYQGINLANIDASGVVLGVQFTF